MSSVRKKAIQIKVWQCSACGELHFTEGFAKDCCYQGDTVDKSKKGQR
jgi:hypothetical protein